MFSARRNNLANPFRAFQGLFIGLNSLIAAVIAALFYMMARSSSIDDKYRYSLAGSLVCAFTAIAMAVSFLVFGASQCYACDV